MPRPITSYVNCGGRALAPSQDLESIILHQELFGHHSFEVLVPFDNVEGPGEAFFSSAHRRLLAQPLTIELVADLEGLGNGQLNRFRGVVTGLASSKDTDYVGSIVVRGQSPFYLLTDGFKRRTFVKQTLKDIFAQVLSKYPSNWIEYVLKPQHTEPVPYVVQYDETNFDFLSRLATEYGEWFYYDGTTLRLGAPADNEEIAFEADGTYNTFAFGMALKPARVKLYEYDYQRHQHHTSSTSSQRVPGIQSHPFGSFALAQSEALFADEVHLPAEVLVASARALNEEAQLLKGNTAAELVTLEGRSDNPELRVGAVISISGEGLGSRHITSESFGKYRILSITHRVDAAGNYSNTFTAVPHFLHVPPLRPGYSAPHGQPELAEVVDTHDPQHLGRVRVRYPWPVELPNHAETDWLRVLTPYSGAGKGQLFTPELGSQVVVAYQSGLAEQPYVQGNLFHAKNKAGAKYTHNGGEIKGIQTMAGNRVTFFDKKGEEKIVITNGKKKDTAINVSFKGDGSIHINSKGPVTVNGSVITLDAGEKGEIRMRAKTIAMQAEEEIQVASKKKSVAVKAKDKITLDAKTATVTGSSSAQLLSSSTVDVGTGSTVNISASVINQS